MVIFKTLSFFKCLLKYPAESSSKFPDFVAPCKKYIKHMSRKQTISEMVVHPSVSYCVNIVEY